jgi:hypothetical protein
VMECSHILFPYWHKYKKNNRHQKQSDSKSRLSLKERRWFWIAIISKGLGLLSSTKSNYCNDNANCELKISYIPAYKE